MIKNRFVIVANWIGHGMQFRAIVDEKFSVYPRHRGGDKIVDTLESTSQGINSDLNNPDTYNMKVNYPAYATYGDNEIRCRKLELSHSITVNYSQDWSCPGNNIKKNNKNEKYIKNHIRTFVFKWYLIFSS